MELRIVHCEWGGAESYSGAACRALSFQFRVYFALQNNNTYDLLKLYYVRT